MSLWFAAILGACFTWLTIYMIRTNKSNAALVVMLIGPFLLYMLIMFANN
jgi:hypothetical protein